MATSGTQTSYGGPSGKYYLQTKWTLLSQSTTGNSSRINIKMYIGASSGWSASIGTNSFSVSVTGGGSWSGSNRSINISGSKQLLIDEDYTVDHNSDGAKSISINPYFTGSYIGTINPGSFSDSLPRIARASEISSTVGLNAGIDKTISIDSRSDDFTHNIRVYITNSDDGTDDFITQIDYGKGVTSRNTNFTDAEIADFFDGGFEKYSKVHMRLSTYSGSTLIGTYSKNGGLYWPSDNSTASGENFTVGGTTKVTINKASDLYYHYVEIRLSNGVVLASSGLVTGTSVTLTPSASLAYSNIKTSSSFKAYVYVRTVLKADTGVEIKGWSNKDTITGTFVNEGPTLGSLSYVDGNSTTLQTTGNGQWIISGYSTPKFTFGTATGKNGASISRYTISLDGQTKSVTTVTAITMDPVKTQSSTSATLTVTDSRGFSSSKSITVTVLPYHVPTRNITLMRDNGFENTGKIQIKGLMSSLNGRNNMDATADIKYRYRISGGVWPTSYTNLAKTVDPAEVNGDKKYATVVATFDLPKENTYEFEFVIYDRVQNLSEKKILTSGRPLFFIDSYKNSLGFLQFPTQSNTFEMFGKMLFDRSKYATGTTNDSPINFNNSDAIGLNGVFFNDVADNNGEGLLFPKSGAETAYDKAYSLGDWNNFRIMDDVVYLDGKPMYMKTARTLWSGLEVGSNLSETKWIGNVNALDYAPNGLIFIFSDWNASTSNPTSSTANNGTKNDYHWVHIYVPRWQLENYSGTGILMDVASTTTTASRTGYTTAVKYFYVTPSGFRGHEDNYSGDIQLDVTLRAVITY